MRYKKEPSNVFALSVAMNAHTRRRSGGVATVVQLFRVAETTSMERPSVYPYLNTEAPGVNIHRLRREALNISQRALGDACTPALDHTTIRRLENNQGYTQDSLERVAVAFSKLLNAKIEVQDLFLPLELAEWPALPQSVKDRLAQGVQDAVTAARYRKHK